MNDRVASAVCEAIRRVLQDSGRDPGRSLEPATLLVDDLGLDSLDLAQTVVLLERSLGVDPFRHEVIEQPSLRTVGDLISIYTKSAGAA
jgi:acyl carrier protein